MRTIALLAFLASPFLLASCMKDAEDAGRSLGLVTPCGADGARLEGQVGGSAFCASAQLLAVGDGASVMVTGIALGGASLVIQFDSLAVGQQAVTEASNGMLYTEAGSMYTVMPQQPGLLTITHADTAARILKAAFEAVLHNEMSGQARAVQGSLEVTWQPQ